MAYEVTATRKRPQTFEQVVGQDFFVTTLKASLAGGKIAHAYLFSGPRGVGKTSAARILAKSLNCESGPTDSPCGVCSNCSEIDRGNSLDVIEIDGASNTSVNDVRQIKDEVLFSPNSSKYKIYIIDEVHMLSNSAFNALLKTIEEPPPYVVFVFATTAVHKVPATIRSRCQQFVFRLISVNAIKEKLAETAAENGVTAEDDALFWISKEATGSLRDAYTLFDQIASFSEGNITLELIREKLGSVGLDGINEISQFLVEGKVKEALQVVDDILHRGVSVEQFVIDLAEYFRCLLFLKIGIERESLLGYRPESFSKKVLDSLNDIQLEKALELVFDLYRNFRYSLNQRFELELTLSRMSALTTYVSPADLLGKITDLRREITGDTISAKTAGASATGGLVSPGEEIPESDAPPAVTAENVVTADGVISDAARDAIIAAVRKKHLSLASSLAKASSWRIEGESLILTCESSYAAENIKREQSKLREYAVQVLGKSCKIVLEENQPAGGGRPAAWCTGWTAPCRRIAASTTARMAGFMRSTGGLRMRPFSSRGSACRRTSGWDTPSRRRW